MVVSGHTLHEGAQRCIHPEHVSILQMRLRVTLLGVDKVGELRGVPKELEHE